jgi:hypothetical protein
MPRSTAAILAKAEAFTAHAAAMQKLINHIARCTLSSEVQSEIKECSGDTSTLDYFITQARLLEFSENGE